MTYFLRLLAEDDKGEALCQACARLRAGATDPRHFEVAPESFDAVPGKPFAYWVRDVGCGDERNRIDRDRCGSSTHRILPRWRLGEGDGKVRAAALCLVKT